MDDVDWSRTCFVLLAPDALARHLGGAILDRLDGLGFVPMAWRVLWHRPVDLDAFHEKNITHAWKAYLYRLVDQLFAVGPTVALLVRDTVATTGQDSHPRLRHAKGASEPAGAGPGTIRGELGSINAMLALMHSADTPADSQQESAVFFDGWSFAGEGGVGDDPARLRAMLGLLAVAGQAERRGYPEVLAGVRARLLVAVWDDLSAAARAEVTDLLGGELTGPWAGGAAGPLAGGVGGAAGPLAGGVGRLCASGVGERLAGLLPPTHPLVPVLAADFAPHRPGPPIDRVRPLLRVRGTDLDPWEDLVLATSRRFQPRGLAGPGLHA